MGTVEQMPGSRMTPQTLLAMALEAVEKIEDVAIVYHWKDGSVTAGWSTCEAMSLVAMARLLSINADQVFVDDNEDE